MAKALQHHQIALIAGLWSTCAKGIQPVLATVGSTRANAIIYQSRWYKKSVRPAVFVPLRRNTCSILVRLILKVRASSRAVLIRPGELMEILKNDTHKKYTLYAEHCLKMVGIATDQKLRIIQRQMAAEWLKLADAVPGQSSK